MTNEQIIQGIEKYKIQAYKNSRVCNYPNCKNFAINSHLLQKNGILNKITDSSNHLYELSIKPYGSPPLSFERVGYNKALTFKGFCSKHDTIIFSPIETKEIDYNNYQSQLLFSYKAIVNERLKKQILLDAYNNILEDINFCNKLPEEVFNYISESTLGYVMGIQDNSYYLSLMLNELEDFRANTFKFFTYVLPKIDVCVSGVFTYETTEEIRNLPIEEETKPLTQIYFNLLPEEDYSVIIIGCERKKLIKCKRYIKEFGSSNKDKVLKLISDLLISQLENWLCSNSFYKTNIQPREGEFIRHNMDSINPKNTNERRSVPFNLFRI